MTKSDEQPNILFIMADDWENLYKSQSVETMPWYNERFDSDLERELDQRKIIANGKKFLTLVQVLQLKLYG